MNQTYLYTGYFNSRSRSGSGSGWSLSGSWFGARSGAMYGSWSRYGSD